MRLSLRAESSQRVADRIEAANSWVIAHKIPLGEWLNGGVQFAMHHAQRGFDVVSNTLGWLVNSLTAALMRIPALLLISSLTIGVYALRRRLFLAMFIWARCSSSTIWGSGTRPSRRFRWSCLPRWCALYSAYPSASQPRTVHGFTGYCIRSSISCRPFLRLVYLIPTLVLFGLGVVPGLISTVIFAIPAPIRLTHLGIASVPNHLLDVGEAFGATRRQLLFKVELPHALPTIMEGITQCIMLSLSMVVIAALVGADGLGKPVVRALNSVNIAMGSKQALPS